MGAVDGEVVVSGVMQVVAEHGTVLFSEQCSGVLAKVLEAAPSVSDRELLNRLLPRNGSETIDVILRGTLRPEKKDEECFELCTPYYFEYSAVICAKPRAGGANESPCK